jgi:nitrite reductase/ring-hydroxylating ferredoxin subunit
MDAIPDDRPVCVTVAADRWDAYIHYPSGPIGRVWMLRTDAAGGDGVFRCFQAICPHLGCLIEYSPGRGTFHCPCHASAFDKDGQRLFGPSPRDMDPLPLRVTEPDDDGHRWVEVDYQEFETGVAERRPVA